MKKAGVIGWPIKHSLSPQLHGWWLRHYGIEGSYESFPVEPGQLENFLKNLQAGGFSGINVTVPHKQAVIPFLHELSPTAQRIGAVNTIVVRPDGSLFGDSTDGYGFITSLQEEAPLWQTDKPAMVLGAGGAARAVVDALYGAGVSELHIINRTRDHAEALAKDLRVPVRLHNWEAAPTLLGQMGLVINTTLLGMSGQPEIKLSLAGLAKDAVVFDLIYNPLETALLRQARLQGNTGLNGLGMLLHQAAPGFTYWFGTTPQVMPEQRASLEAILA